MVEDQGKSITVADIEAFVPGMQELRVAHISEHMSPLIESLRAAPETYLGIPINHWPNFNQCFGGIRGELITITADTGSGKSTFLRNMLFHLLAQSVPCMLVSLEDSMHSVMRVLQQMITARRMQSLTKEDISSVLKWMKTAPLYYLDYHGPIKSTFSLKLVDYCAQKLGIKFLAIDHLDYIQPPWDGRPEAYVVGDYVRQLSGRAQRYNMGVCLVVHPAKRGLKGGSNPEIGLDELKGSSSIKQESASVIALHRPDRNSTMTNLRFLKIRCPEFGRFAGARLEYQMSQTTGCFNERGGIHWD